jgi:hypothetical protein
LTATQGNPVWLPETGTRRLRFTAEPTPEATDDRIGLLLPALPNVEHILLDTLGRQHVIVRSGAVALQLTITEHNAVIAPVALRFRLHRRHEIGVAAEQLVKLHRLLSAYSVTRAPPRWTAETKRLRDALIALDGHRAGATLRETAIVIYGRERIEREWPGKGLRQRLRRSLQRGQALCNGGYRDLLR